MLFNKTRQYNIPKHYNNKKNNKPTHKIKKHAHAQTQANSNNINKKTQLIINPSLFKKNPT